jgi:hypothetical protein
LFNNDSNRQDFDAGVEAAKPKEAPWLDVQSSNYEKLAEGNYQLDAIPIEFNCDRKFGCSIPMVSARWSNLNSDAVCIWTGVGGTGRVPAQFVTTSEKSDISTKELVEIEIETVLCQDPDGTIHYGTRETKIVPSGGAT